MSNYGRESGTFHLSTQDLSRMRRRFHEQDHKAKTALYDRTQEFWKGLTRAQQSNPDKYNEAVREEEDRIWQAHGEDATLDFESAVQIQHQMVEHPERGRILVPKKPERVKKSDIHWPNTHTRSFSAGDLTVSFDKAEGTVTYGTNYNNHSPEQAAGTSLAALFHHQMNSNRYRKDDGGHLTKTGEYGTYTAFAIGPRGWRDAPEAAVDYIDSRDARHNARTFINTGLSAKTRPASGTQMRKGQQGIPTTNRGHFGSTVRDEPRGL